ncbi:MAG: imidazoleglycerol-phosphate dehydratase HisB [Candidatus Scalindua sp.]|jgi:imidazoleglycerol-phosphate dehydratase|nr:imidazoleglycerol-phosphate dehydratase HisB [Candidatus Scalindua sp.]MBT6045614.1 imidazoleglycerol-phosphate dehydratase HisB [Candidatus Scalindua sp.]MBT6225072.1 imidazoleglycerol-phosphate dehydratase HisB [Candidatus Scalindua sp.]MBT7211299.1 imidazoleglycerol-phosphate dehydratase HisB [Candidatus Scalindua sp.]MBT7592959.1 imidazoleglycerol-phosphate dehydratase HisB [Candidatus Scalindua sp.]
MKNRISNIDRKTNETNISLSLNLDGEGKRSVSTGIGFFDHMLDLFAKHALFDLEIKATGDTHVDFHHTVEDVGICVGLAVKEALGDKAGIVRFSNVSVPMQESLANIALDISGRSALVFNAKLDSKKIGDFDSELIKEFLEAFTVNAGLNLHVDVPYGENAHHIAEAIFKGLAKAIDRATRIDERTNEVPSTKGVL